jgi:hypothetical protein
MPVTRERTQAHSDGRQAGQVQRRDQASRPAAANGGSAENDGAKAESDRTAVAAPLAAARRGLAVTTRTLVRLIHLAAGVIAAIIAVGILFVVLEANPANTIVSTVHDMARALVGPFAGMFELDNAKTAIAVNWGIAAFAYLILGALIAWIIAVIGTAGLRLRRG